MNNIVRISIMVIGCLCFHCQSSQHSEESLIHTRTISPEEVYNIINDSIRVREYVILDTRDRMAYIRGHLVSAYWVSEDSLESKIAILRMEQRPLIVYNTDVIPANSKLKAIFNKHRITNAYFMDGGFSEWMKKGYPAAIQLVRNTDVNASFKRLEVSTVDAYRILSRSDSEYVLIDIRASRHYDEGHIRGALSIPFVPINEFVVKLEEQDFPRDKPIIIYGEPNSDLNDKAYEVFKRNDFKNVFVLKGGLNEWSSRNFPIAYANN
jgi:rhodanese-related sulfurtransferase